MSRAAIDVAGVPGVPESALAADVLDRLPGSAPAPWRTRLSAVVWVHRAAPAALQQLDPALRRRHLPVTVGAFVRYADTPVGPYSEVLASPVVLLDHGIPAASIPFIAVDSLASIHGGRANWSLPKTLASFTWRTPQPGFGVQGAGRGWGVTAAARVAGPRIPLAAAGRDVQPTPEGGELVAGLTVRGLGRAARVRVDVDGPTLPRWLLSGDHAGLVLSRARMTFGVPRRR